MIKHIFKLVGDGGEGGGGVVSSIGHLKHHIVFF